MRYILLLFFFFCITVSSAQGPLDKLRNSLKDAEGIELIDIQQQLASRVRHYNVKEADSLIRISILKSQELSYKHGESLGYTVLGGLIGNKGDFYEAEELIKKAISIAELHQETKALSAAYINLGALYLQNDLKQLAIENHILGAKVSAQDTAIIDYEIVHLMNLGIIHLMDENMKLARGYLTDAQEKSEKRSNIIRTGQIYVNRAIVETETKNFGIAKEFYLKGLKIFKDAKLESFIQRTQIGLARCHVELGELQEAKKYLDLANIYFSLPENSTSKSAQHFTLYYACYSFQLGDFDNALKYLKESLLIAKKYDSKKEILKIHQLYSDIYQKRGNLKLALEASKKALVVKDSIHKGDKKSAILSLTKKFDYERLAQEKENELQDLDADIKLRNIYVLILIFLILFLGFLFSWNRNRLKLNYLKNKVKIEAKQQKIIQEVKEHQLEKEYLIKQTTELIEKNTSLRKNLEILQKLQEKDDSKVEAEDFIQKIRSSLLDDKNWLTFNLYFEKLYPNFSETLKTNFKAILTQYELRLLALMKMDLTNKEIAIILGIQRNSVVQAKTRLRDKLGFPDLVDLESYLHKMA